MQNHTSETRQALVKDVDKLKQNAVQIAQDVRDHASAHVDETKQRVTDTYVNAREALTENPLAILGIGFVLGLIVGLKLRS
jgi:ElaB/YqjD/DUF883 family membrane-anchored ribosome-binding protein